MRFGYGRFGKLGGVTLVFNQHFTGTMDHWDPAVTDGLATQREVNEKVAPAQIEAISKWGAPREKPFEYLKSIRQPALVVNGGKDVIIYSVNPVILQQHLPNAQLILYPDASHGSQYQYPQRFVQHGSLFLS